MNGALPSGAVVTATTGTYTVARRHSGRTPQLLRVPRGSTGTSFDLELRATSGTFDTFASGSNPVSGVQIRISPNAIDDIAQTKLLDATPATELFDDGAFTPGTSLVDASSGVSIRVTAVTSTSATIIVESATDTSAPSAPGNLAGTATQSGAVLRWTAATDNVGIVSYQVAQDGQLLGTVTGTTFTTTGATPNTDHSYLAWARDRAGNPGPAATLTVHTLPDTTPPSGVGKLIATTTSTTIIVSWTRATDNGVLYGYEALIDGQPRWVTLAQCCSLTIQGLAPASSHTFSVTAIDIGGNRGTSSTLTARTKTASGR
ncbi:MAG: fibronectin type III domain-containing protein [Acidimicrobiia bacterium]